MKVETQLVFRQYLKLTFFLSYRRPVMILLSLVGLTMLVASIVAFMGLPSLYNDNPYFPLLFGLYLAVLMPILIYWSAKKSYKSNGRLQERMIYEFTPDLIRVEGETFHTEMDWSKVFKVVEHKNWVLIYQSRISANLIPKDNFGDLLDEFKQIVKAKHVKAKFRN